MKISSSSHLTLRAAELIKRCLQINGDIVRCRRKTKSFRQTDVRVQCATHDDCTKQITDVCIECLCRMNMQRFDGRKIVSCAVCTTTNTRERVEVMCTQKSNKWKVSEKMRRAMRSTHKCAHKLNHQRNRHIARIRREMQCSRRLVPTSFEMSERWSLKWQFTQIFSATDARCRSPWTVKLYRRLH